MAGGSGGRSAVVFDGAFGRGVGFKPRRGDGMSLCVVVGKFQSPQFLSKEV